MLFWPLCVFVCVWACHVMAVCVLFFLSYSSKHLVFPLSICLSASHTGLLSVLGPFQVKLEKNWIFFSDQWTLFPWHLSCYSFTLSSSDPSCPSCQERVKRGNRHRQCFICLFKLYPCVQMMQNSKSFAINVVLTSLISLYLSSYGVYNESGK